MLRFVVALQAEARPIVERFRMVKAGDGPFPVFRSEAAESDDWLIVSGPGKASAAAATAYLHLFSGGALGRAWLNVGLGGHSTRPVGEGVIAHKISDAASGASGYPQLVVDVPRPTVPVLTIERVEEDYSPPWVYDTEAAGFFSIACRFSVSELVHCFKVVSDNPDATLSRRMSSIFLEHLIARNLGDLEVFARDLTALAGELAVLSADPPGYAEALASSPFPAVRQPRLRRLLQRLAVLDPGADLGILLAGARGGDEVLARLEARLAAVPVRLPAAEGVAADDLR